jgi:hypothetical protein
MLISVDQATLCGGVVDDSLENWIIGLICWHKTLFHRTMQEVIDIAWDQVLLNYPTLPFSPPHHHQRGGGFGLKPPLFTPC